MNRNSMGSWGTTDRSGGAGAIGSRPSSQDYRSQTNNQFNVSLLFFQPSFFFLLLNASNVYVI